MQPPNGDDSVVWHYTGADAFDSIIRSGYLRASSFEKLADATELQLLPPLIERLIGELPSALSRRLEIPFGAKLSLPDVREVSSPYIACLSRNIDDPKLWQDFAGRGSGVAIGFFQQCIEETIGTDFNAVAQPVRYLNEAELEQEASAWVSRLAGVVTMAIPDDDDFWSEYQYRLRNLAIDLVREIPFVKHHSFLHEAEHRIITHRVDYDTEGCVDRIRFGKEALHTVLLGPRMSRSLSDVESMLSGEGYSVTVERSRWARGAIARTENESSNQA